MAGVAVGAGIAVGGAGVAVGAWVDVAVGTLVAVAAAVAVGMAGGVLVGMGATVGIDRQPPRSRAARGTSELIVFIQQQDSSRDIRPPPYADPPCDRRAPDEAMPPARDFQDSFWSVDLAHWVARTSQPAVSDRPPSA